MNSKIYTETATIAGFEDYEEFAHMEKIALCYCLDQMAKNRETNQDAYEYFRKEADRIGKFSKKMMDQFFTKAV